MIGTVARELGAWVADQQGIDKERVVRIDLHLDVREYATMEVTMLAKSQGAWEEQLKKYKLVSIDEESSDEAH